MKKIINIIGSTGSIGSSTFEILKMNLDKFEINIILGFKNFDYILNQAKILKPKIVFISREFLKNLKENLKSELIDCKVFPVEDFFEIMNSSEIEFKKDDISLISVKGFIGLKFSLEMIKRSKRICLANKESVICGGEIFMNEIKKHECELIPLDSEHNTIFQILDNLKEKEKVKNLVITASGGPFLKQILGGKIHELKKISPQMAANHPKWKMGFEISINSATLMNKAHELIEAYFLFGIQNVSAIIHPEHIIHGFVNLKNGMSLMGAANPDMKIHISHGLFYGEKNFQNFECMNLSEIKNLSFFEIKNWPFNFIDLAYEIIQNNDLKKSIILNALNEIALKFFIQGKISFLGINEFIFNQIEKISNQFEKISSFDQIFEIDSFTRKESLAFN
jgi:1-deoxy-D-xylulose-5-phosphate reductoisomerase